MKNVRGQYQPLNSWRKISLGSWRPTGDSAIRCIEEIEVEDILAWTKRRDTSAKITLTHYLGLALAKALAKNPGINGFVRWGKFFQRQDIDVFFLRQIETAEGEELSGLLVRKMDRKDLSEIAEEFKNAAEPNEIKNVKSLYRFFPGIFSRWILNLLSFVLYKLNISLGFLGVPRDAFGSIQVTNVGHFGMDTALTPIAPYTQISMVVSIGAVKARPWAEDGKLTVKKTVKMGFVYDHRLWDGLQFGNFLKDFKTELVTLRAEEVYDDKMVGLGQPGN